jgi:hypothetical protein
MLKPIMKIVNTFEKHKSEPGKNLEAYTRDVRLALGVEIGNCKKIYMDTKYWLLLRDALLGRAGDKHLSELLSLLRSGVQAGKAICPISEDIFVEVLKQSDPLTLKETVKLMDDLSKGVSILSEEERIRFETLYFILRHTKGEDSVYSPDVFVWTKLSYVFGAIHPASTPFSPKEELVLQKAFFDQMWSISLSEIVEIIGMEAILKMPKLNDFSVALNDGKAKHAHENKSFKQVFLSELAGILDLCIPIFEDARIYLLEKEKAFKPTAAEMESTNSGKQIANSVYNLFSKNKLHTYFPTLIISAGLHATVRWDVKRKFKRNDWHDFRHAQTALPYFDFFLTEHSLRNLITMNNTAFHRKYSCVVLSNPDEALESIKEMFSQQRATFR